MIGRTKLGDANQAYLSLKQHNNMNMTFEPHGARNSDDNRSARQYNSKRSDYVSDDIETSTDFMYDAFGNKVLVLFSNEDQIYVPLENLKGSGYKLTKNPPSMQEPNEQWINKLKAFLLQQASVFVYMNQVQFNTKTILANINSILQELDITKKVPASMNSSGSVHEGDTNNQKHNNFKPRSKTVTMQLNVSHKVQFLNDHAEGVYYVRLVDNQDIYNKITNEINSLSGGPGVAPKMNGVYGVKYDNVWYRGTLTRTNSPQEMFLIDEGIVVNGRLEIRLIPEGLYKIPGQAIRVRLTRGCKARKDEISHVLVTQEYADGTYLIKPTESASGFSSDGSVRSFNKNKPKMSTPKKDEWETGKQEITFPKRDFNNADNQNKRTSLQNNNNFGAKQQNDFEPVQTLNFGNQQKPVQQQNYSNNLSNEPKPIQNIVNEEKQNSFNKQEQSEEQNSVLKTSNNLNNSVNHKSIMSKITSEVAGRVSSMSPKPKAPVVKSNRKCISDVLDSTNGCMEFMQMQGNDSFIAFILPSSKLDDLMLLEGIAEDVQHNSNFSPSVGDTVVVDHVQEGETEPSSVRAVLLEKNGSEFKVALIDYGQIKTVEKLSELPAKYMDIVEYAACCTTDKKYINSIKEQLRFNYASERKGEMVIDMNGEQVKVLCGKWSPLTNNEEEVVLKKQIVVTTLPPANPLKLNEKVKLISQIDNMLAIRTRESYLILQQMTEELTKHKVEALQNPPTVNQIVLYKEDGSAINMLYRAQVKIISNNQIEIFKLDYGQTDTTEAGNLYYIDKFHNINHTLHLKTLAGFDEIYKNTTVQDFIKTLLKKENFVMCSEKNNEIELLFSDGTSLVTKLTSMLRPPFKSLDDIPPPGNLSVGESADVMIMHIEEINLSEKSLTLWISDIQKKFIELSEKLEECDNLPLSTSFYKGQVCVAKYDGAWYRAEIKDVDAKGSSFNVHFFDFGNYEKISIGDLRELPDDLSEFPPMAVKCHVKNVFNKYNGNIPEECKERLENCEGTGVTAEIISRNGNTYSISIPQLE